MNAGEERGEKGSLTSKDLGSNLGKGSKKAVLILEP